MNKATSCGRTPCPALNLPGTSLTTCVSPTGRTTASASRVAERKEQRRLHAGAGYLFIHFHDTLSYARHEIHIGIFPIPIGKFLRYPFNLKAKFLIEPYRRLIVNIHFQFHSNQIQHIFSKRDASRKNGSLIAAQRCASGAACGEAIGGSHYRFAHTGVRRGMASAIHNHKFAIWPSLGKFPCCDERTSKVKASVDQDSGNGG